MKNIKYFVAFVIVATLMAVSAFATITLQFDLEEATAETGDACYIVAVTQSDDEGDWRSLQTKISFNYEKIIPVDYYDASIPEYVGEGASYPVVPASLPAGRKTLEISTPSAPEWTIDGENSSVVVETYWSKVDEYPATVNETTIYEMYIKLADGVDPEDLEADDFVVTYVVYANGVFNYAGDEDVSKNNITVVNNVVPAPVNVKTAKLPVNAGDVVYKAGADIAPVVVDEDGTYDIVVNADTEGTYIVNTGYTAQKVYTVKADLENGFAEVADYEDGILGKSGVSVRYVTPQGIRFKGEVKDTIRNRADLVEYGFIMTAESAYNNLPENYVLDMALVGTGKAKRGVAYDKGTTDLYAEKTADSTIIAGVLHGIPKTKANVQTPIASRPYYKLEDGSYVYGEITRASIYEVAKAIYNVEGYEAAWEYAKEIIELVDGPMPVELENEIAIDISSLYN